MDNNFNKELERIKSFNDYDLTSWTQLYKSCKPLIKRLSKNIDIRKLNTSIDIIESMFWDKFLYIYNKYQKELDYEHLKANILNGLKRYAYKLMRDCYSQQSEFNQTIVSIEDLFDNPEDIDIEDEGYQINLLIQKLDNFLLNRLTADEYLVHKLMLNPPPFLLNRMKSSKGKLSVVHLIDYFEFPRNKASYVYFNSMRLKVKHTLEEAKAEFNK